MTTTIQSTLFQPSFMQKVLGRNYKWWYLIVSWIKAGSVNWINDFLWFIGQAISLFVIVILFDKFATRTDLTYIILGNLFYGLSSNTIYWPLSNIISSGKFTRYLLVPTSAFKAFFCFAIGSMVKVNTTLSLVTVPLIVMFFEKIDFRIPSFEIIFLLVLSFIIRYLLGLCVGMISFCLPVNDGAINLFENILPFLAGGLIPLILLNQPFLTLTPFSILLHHPMQIYLGKYSPVETLLVLAGGIVWCIVLYLLAKLVFNLGLKRNEAVGL